MVLSIIVFAWDSILAFFSLDNSEVINHLSYLGAILESATIPLYFFVFTLNNNQYRYLREKLCCGDDIKEGRESEISLNPEIGLEEDIN